VFLVYYAWQFIIQSQTISSHSTGKIHLLKLTISGVQYKSYSILAIVILSFVLFNFEKLYGSSATLVAESIKSLKIRARESVQDGILYLALIPIFASVYFLLKLPVSYDEALTYITFTSKGLLTTISFYPYPNNHILYTILTNISTLLPVNDTLAIRIPAILINVLCIFFLFNFIKDYFNIRIAQIATAVFSVMKMTLYYSYMARGYGLECLFFILLSHLTLKIIEHPENKMYWKYYAIACVSGFYTMPSFLYPFLIANAFILIYLKSITRNHLIFNLQILVITGILYFPIIRENGLNSLTNNTYVKPIGRIDVIHQIPNLFYSVFADTTGLPGFFIILLVALAVIFLISDYHGKAKYYFPFVLLASPILLILHSVIPFTRTFEYFTCILALFSGIFLVRAFQFTYIQKYFWIWVIMIQILMAYNSGREIFDDEKYSITSEKEIAELHSGNKFLCYSTLFGTYAKYYNSKNKNFVINDHIVPLNMKNMKVIRSMNDVSKFQTFAVNLDTISDRTYDFYIVDNKCDSTIKKTPISKSDFHTIYRH